MAWITGEKDGTVYWIEKPYKKWEGIDSIDKMEAAFKKKFNNVHMWAVAPSWNNPSFIKQYGHAICERQITEEEFNEL